MGAVWGRYGGGNVWGRYGGGVRAVLGAVWGRYWGRYGGGVGQYGGGMGVVGPTFVYSRSLGKCELNMIF